MLIKFKNLAQLRSIANDSDVKTKLDGDFDSFLEEIAGKEYPAELTVVGGGKLTKFYTISTASVGVDGGYNTNTVFEHFSVPEEWLQSVDKEGKTYWACVNCGHTVEPSKQKDPFRASKTYEEIEIENAVCPRCFTKSFKVI